MKRNKCVVIFMVMITVLVTGCTSQKAGKSSAVTTSKTEVLAIINKVNNYWQRNNTAMARALGMWLRCFYSGYILCVKILL